MNISLFLLSALYYDNIWFGIFLFNVKLMTLRLNCYVNHYNEKNVISSEFGRFPFHFLVPDKE